MVRTLKRLKKQLKRAWPAVTPGYLQAALEVLDNAGATQAQVDAYCKLWPFVHAASEAGECSIPCPRCFLAKRTHWLVRAVLGTGVHEGSAWRSGYVCEVCGYAPYVPAGHIPDPADTQ